MGQGAIPAVLVKYADQRVVHEAEVRLLPVVSAELHGGGPVAVEVVQVERVDQFGGVGELFLAATGKQHQRHTGGEQQGKVQAHHPKGK